MGGRGVGEGELEGEGERGEDQEGMREERSGGWKEWKEC